MSHTAEDGWELVVSDETICRFEPLLKCEHDTATGRLDEIEPIQSITRSILFGPIIPDDLNIVPVGPLQSTRL